MASHKHAHHARQESGEVIGQLEEMQVEGLIPPSLKDAARSSISSGVQGEEGEDEPEVAALEMEMRVSVV